MRVYFTKTLSGMVPVDPQSKDWYDKQKIGAILSGEFKKVRNYRFLKKYFSLLTIGFNNWTPGEIDSRYGKPEKNFERFRADLTILAGYYETTIRLDGSVRVEPKSISFAGMEEEDFAELYSKTIDVLIKYVYGSEMTPEEMDGLVMKYLEFA